MSAPEIVLPDGTRISVHELYPRRQLTERHPDLLPENRVAWALRNRRKNGLNTAGAVFDSPCGELLIHEPRFLAWFLGLAGRAKPRSPRRHVAGVPVK
jgi:hypothetical protein